MTWSKTTAEPSLRAQRPLRHPGPSGWMRLALVVAFLIPAPGLAASLTYLESFPASDSAATLIHLIDGDLQTEWCAPDNQGSTRIRFHFDSPQAITHARIVLSEAPAAPVSIKLSTSRLILSIGMEHQKLRVELTKPLEGSFVDVILSGQQPSRCFNTIEFASRSEKLTQLRAAPHILKRRLALAGTWKRGPLGSPKTSWTFSLDGSWRWEHRSPLLARSKSLRGTWKILRDQLILTTPNRNKPIKLSLTRRDVAIDEWAEDAPDYDYQELNIGSAVNTPLAGRYNNASFEMLD